MRRLHWPSALVGADVTVAAWMLGLTLALLVL
jgi:hypothetical protein